MTRVFDQTGIQRIAGSSTNPVPSLSALSPSFEYEGAGDTVVTLTGTNFIPNSSARVNGSARSTSFVNSTTLTMTITSTDLANDGSLSITVNNPSPGGGQSGVQSFVVRAGDPLFSSVVLLLRSQNAINGQTTFIDDSPIARPLTRSGSAIYDDGESLFGSASIRLDLSGDNWVTMANSADFDFSDRTTEFCVEAWVNFDDLSHVNTIMSGRDSGGAEEWEIRNGSASPESAGMSLYASGSPVASAFTGALLTEGNWHHIAGTRENVSGDGFIRIFVDGVLGATTTQTSNGTLNTGLYYIGHNDFDDARDFEGYIDSVRVTRGNPRYTSAFTVPNLPFPPS